MNEFRPIARERARALDALRASAANDDIVLRLVQETDERLPRSSAELAQAIAESTGIDPSPLTASSVPADSVGIATFSGGECLFANALFTRCVPDGGDAQLAAIRQRAQTQGRAIGLVPGADGAMVCVLGVSRATGLTWPILTPHLAGADAQAVAMMVLSPSRAEQVFERTAASAGLSRLERQITHALLEHETLNDAAAELGIARETAKAARAAATRRVGVGSAAELVGLLVDLSCAQMAPPLQDEAGVAQRLLGLPNAEARVAVALAQRRSIKDVANVLGLQPDTVKTHQRAIFAKAGVHRSRAFRRLLKEALALDAMASLAQVLPDATRLEQRLKFIFRPDGRRLAMVDYGPRRAEPLFVGHGDSTGRLLPDVFVTALQAAGFRPLVLQRPGFGLSSRADGGAFLATAADDMSAVLDSLKAERGSFLMRDGGAATGLEFALRHPARLNRAVLQNPRQPKGTALRGLSPFAPMRRFIQAYPELIEQFGELLRSRSRADLLKGALRRAAEAVPADKALLADEKVLDLLVSDIHGLITASAAGFVDEHRVFNDGWQVPTRPLGGLWTVFASGALFQGSDETPWRQLSNVRASYIEGGGTFVQWTHPKEIVALLKD